MAAGGVTGRIAGERVHIDDRVGVSNSATGFPFSGKHRMKLAERMSRIGVETAFDVLVRARALEAQGTQHHPPGNRRARFPTPAHIVEAGKRALDEGWTHYGPTQGLPELARGDR